MQEFRTVKAWQLAHQLALDLYGLTEAFPRSEAFGMVMQLRRAGLNAPLRIAEGCGQTQQANKLKALGTARAGQVELEYLLLLARDLGLLTPETYAPLQDRLIEARKTLSGFIKAIENGPPPQEMVQF